MEKELKRIILRGKTAVFVDWANVYGWKKILERIESFVFLTGDGDYEPLYKLLIDLKKQVVVIYTKGHLGREIWNMKKGIFKIEIINLMDI